MTIIMQPYGTKDVMRIQDIRKRANGDFIEEVKLAYRMANEIEDPGKALARGYASIQVYQSNYSPIAGIFFERACELSGEKDLRNINVSASMLSVSNEDAIEEAFSRISPEKQPASRRFDYRHEKVTISRKKSYFDIISLGKINIVKGTGTGFDSKYMKTGTIEVWKTESNKFRLIYTSSPIPTALFGEKREFRFEDKRENWEMVDYIEVYNIMNLQPLYSTTIPGYMYN
jgi:hypothetical protein